MLRINDVATNVANETFLAPAETKLTELGKTAEEQILKISERFPTVTVENYVIMPNHIHLLIFIDGSDVAGAISLHR